LIPRYDTTRRVSPVQVVWYSAPMFYGYHTICRASSGLGAKGEFVPTRRLNIWYTTWRALDELISAKEATLHTALGVHPLGVPNTQAAPYEFRQSIRQFRASVRRI